MLEIAKQIINKKINEGFFNLIIKIILNFEKKVIDKIIINNIENN